MATRFYFPAEGSGAPSISPSLDAGWEKVSVNRLNLLRKTRLSSLSALADTSTRAVTNATTEDIAMNQFVSEPIPPQRLIGTVSLVMRAIESATTMNVTLAVVVKVVDAAGVSRGTLFSTFNTDTEFGTTAATRIVNAQAITSLTTQPGDRIVVEIGAHAAAPTATGTYTMRQGDNAASDFALTSALTTDLNPWIEFSQDIWARLPENYTAIRAGSGISVSERIR